MQQGFEFWRLNRFRIRVQPGYNSYNQSYNTINLDALAAMQIWTASDPSTNENVSGVTIKSYNNAKVHTVSLNTIKTVVNTKSHINQQQLTPRTILSANSWLDTSVDIGDSNVYSGAQFFAQMNGVTGTNYVPTLQLIFEYDVNLNYQPTKTDPRLSSRTLLVLPLLLFPMAKNHRRLGNTTVCPTPSMAQVWIIASSERMGNPDLLTMTRKRCGRYMCIVHLVNTSLIVRQTTPDLSQESLWGGFRRTTKWLQSGFLLLFSSYRIATVT